MKSIGTLLGTFFIFLTTVVGQSTGRVIGKVFDPEGAAAPYTNVIIFTTTDSTMVKGEVTNDDGLYEINNLPEGNYWIQASFVGYAEYRSDVFNLSAGETKNMPTINLALPDNDLAQIEVVAQRAMIEVLPSKTVFNVEGSINATGNTALELLRKSPGVVVDNNDNIILAGKDGVQVYIDGKPSYLGSADLATYLRSMQSSEIEAIEIITNPSAKYDAAGNAGIINIRLKKDKRLGGNANINLGYQKGIHSKYNGSATFNYRDKRSNFFGSYSFNDGTWENWIDLYRIQSNTLFDGQSTIINDGAYNGGRLGWDFTINDQSTFGVVVNGSHNNRNSRTFNLTSITDLSINELTSVLESRNINDGSRTQVNSNANYAWQNKEGVSWNIDADYGIFRNNNRSEQPNTYYGSDEQTVIDQRDYYSEAPTNIDIYAFKVDHERKLAGGSFSAGIKTSYVKTDNTFDFFDIVNGQQVLDIDRSNNFVFDENINAAYASYNRQIKKWTLNIGLRAEQTNSKGTLTAMKETENAEVDRHYFDLFPSGGLTFQAHQQHQLRLNYSRRIDRPNYQDLNPFEFQLSELSFQRGNPFLQPQYTHNVSFSHTYGYRLTTSIAYSYTQDFFANISDSSGVDRSFLQTINLDNQQVLSLTVSYPFSPTKWWNTYSNLSAFHKRNKADLGDGRLVNISANTATVYHQSTFTLPKAFSLELSGWYSSPSIWGAVYDTEANFSIDMGVQKRFLDGRANLKVAVTDVFRTADWRGVQDFSGFFVEATGGWEATQLRINFSYLLGNDQVKKTRKRKSATEDEMNRAGG